MFNITWHVMKTTYVPSLFFHFGAESRGIEQKKLKSPPSLPSMDF